jgi:23S rRNA pseudouridine1911/1915/1917 synthase
MSTLSRAKGPKHPGKATGRDRSPIVRGRPQLVYEDQDLLVVEKPAGLLTIATTKERRRTLYAYLYDRQKEQRPPGRIFIVHRLDRDVSGLLVFAKTPEAKEALQDQFKSRRAGRAYVALVEGIITEDAFTVRTLLGETKTLRVFTTDDPRRGKSAVTHVKVLSRQRGRTLVEVTLETGRKHQIRVHLAERGHPVVGDRRYGTPLRGTNQLALHAARLRFKHPRTRKIMEFESPPPRWMGVPGSNPRPAARPPRKDARPR